MIRRRGRRMAQKIFDFLDGSVALRLDGSALLDGSSADGWLVDGVDGWLNRFAIGWPSFAGDLVDGVSFGKRILNCGIGREVC